MKRTRTKSTRREKSIDEEMYDDLNISKKSAKGNNLKKTTVLKKEKDVNEILQKEDKVIKEELKKFKNKKVVGKPIEDKSKLKRAKSTNKPVKKKPSKINNIIKVDSSFEETNQNEEEGKSLSKRSKSANKPIKINKNKKIKPQTNSSLVDIVKEELDPEVKQTFYVNESNDKIKKNIMINGKSLLGPVCVRLGLCCINNLLKSHKQAPVKCDRSITLSTYKSKGKIEAITRATQNVKDIIPMLNWNHSHYIHCLRLSSDMFPHYSNVTRIDKDDQYDMEFAREDLEKAGDRAREIGHRITMHPGQYNVVGTPNEDAFKQTIVDLKMHAEILDFMKMDENSIMVVHGGGTYGDKPATIKRWCKNYERLPESVRKRLVLENCEKSFSIVDCLAVNKEIGIPVVFDNHHFECYKLVHPEDKFEDIRVYIKQALETWTKKGLRPKFHISNQAPDKNTGAHSQYINEFPEYYLEIPSKYGIGVDIMIEAKAKEAAIFDLYQRYKTHFLNHIEDEEVDHESFKFNRDEMVAIKCSRC